MWADAIAEIFKVFGLLLKRKKSGKKLTQIVDIYDGMISILSETDIQLTVVITAHNGGGELKPGSTIYKSAVYELYRDPFKSVKAEWQKIELDIEYTRLLKKVYADKKVCLNVDTDLPDGVLKTLLQKENAVYVELHFIHETKEEFHFFMIATAKEGHRVRTQDQRAEILVNVNKIKNKFN